MSMRDIVPPLPTNVPRHNASVVPLSKDSTLKASHVVSAHKTLIYMIDTSLRLASIVRLSSKPRASSASGGGSCIFRTTD